MHGLNPRDQRGLGLLGGGRVTGNSIVLRTGRSVVDPRPSGSSGSEGLDRIELGMKDGPGYPGGSVRPPESRPSPLNIRL